MARLRAGEWVVVRRKEEILATLDRLGRVDGLPFMPEMFQFCGRRFRVFKRAHKTCDPTHGMDGRGMRDAVHLEGVRCSGEAHGGCQAGCLIFWKEVWLERPSSTNSGDGELQAVATRGLGRRGGCSEGAVLAGTLADVDLGRDRMEEPTYVCQATRLQQATQVLRWWNPCQYLEDVTSGNVRVWEIMSGFLWFVYYNLATAGVGLGTAMCWFYDVVQKAYGGTPYPWREGKVAKGMRTPSAKLDLEPGELVKVKSYPDILNTLDWRSRNRGMYFDGEMVPYCNGTYRVLKRVQRIIGEDTGKMIEFETDAIILDGVVCRARYSKGRRFCPRSIYAYWREIWLERTGGGGAFSRRTGGE